MQPNNKNNKTNLRITMILITKIKSKNFIILKLHLLRKNK